jgi:hypothetical protein
MRDRFTLTDACIVLAVAGIFLTPIFALAAGFDPNVIVQQLPVSDSAKTNLLLGGAAAYALALFLRRVCPPWTVVGRAVRALLDGWQHPAEGGPPPQPPASLK